MHLRYGDLAVLIDCGLFQGSRTLETLNREAFPFDASRLAAVILSHAHIDHSGLLPKLVAEGYCRPIWSTPATRDLPYHMPPDAGRIQESATPRSNPPATPADAEPVPPTSPDAEAMSPYAQTRVADCDVGGPT